MPNKKQEITENNEFELSVITNKTHVQKQQRDILLEAINNYLKWRNNKEAPDNRGYQPTIFTWLRHYTAFGEARANGLKNSLSLNPMPDPIELLKRHFQKNSRINNHSLDTYLLESILKNKRLFQITDGFTHLNTLISRVALRQFIIEHKAYSESEYVHLAVVHNNTSDEVLAKKQLDDLLNSNKITAMEITTVGEKYHKARDYTKAKQCFQKACEKGCGTAHSYLGFMYQHAQCVEKNLVTAARYYLLADNKGCVLANNKLKELLNSNEITANELTSIAAMYHNGNDGIAVNWQFAIKIYQRASNLGDQSAPLYLGQIFQMNHEGVQKNITVAFQSYLQAAKLGNAEALSPLERLGDEVSAENQLALSQLYGTFFHNDEKASYWHAKAMEIEQFTLSF